ncbi:hypothetical protein CLF_110738 [Clonorchis sinensis]|uniref:Uncharacterized protein n=1 Tax=Clonorchis sinensis TaxID=79923 RepID=G7YL35_CLOSI|nr:hypothetical protein CLF_110738 [Clonorchis sinensis]
MVVNNVNQLTSSAIKPTTNNAFFVGCKSENATECAAPGRLMFQSLRYSIYRDTCIYVMHYSYGRFSWVPACYHSDCTKVHKHLNLNSKTQQKYSDVAYGEFGSRDLLRERAMVPSFINFVGNAISIISNWYFRTRILRKNDIVVRQRNPEESFSRNYIDLGQQLLQEYLKDDGVWSTDAKRSVHVDRSCSHWYRIQCTYHIYSTQHFCFARWSFRKVRLVRWIACLQWMCKAVVDYWYLLDPSTMESLNKTTPPSDFQRQRCSGGGKPHVDEASKVRRAISASFRNRQGCSSELIPRSQFLGWTESDLRRQAAKPTDKSTICIDLYLGECRGNRTPTKKANLLTSSSTPPKVAPLILDTVVAQYPDSQGHKPDHSEPENPPYIPLATLIAGDSDDHTGANERRLRPNKPYTPRQIRKLLAGFKVQSSEKTSLMGAPLTSKGSDALEEASLTWTKRPKSQFLGWTESDLRRQAAKPTDKSTICIDLYLGECRGNRTPTKKANLLTSSSTPPKVAPLILDTVVAQYPDSQGHKPDHSEPENPPYIPLATLIAGDSDDHTGANERRLRPNKPYTTRQIRKLLAGFKVQSSEKTSLMGAPPKELPGAATQRSKHHRGTFPTKSRQNAQEAKQTRDRPLSNSEPGRPEEVKERATSSNGRNFRPRGKKLRPPKLIGPRKPGSHRAKKTLQVKSNPRNHQSREQTNMPQSSLRSPRLKPDMQTLSLSTCLVGDLSAPKTTWMELQRVGSSKLFAAALTEVVQQSAWTQHVVAPTNYRAGQLSSLMDLVITNERHFVDQMIRRTFSRITRTDFQILYGAYARPLLENANHVVYSGRTKGVTLVGCVQRAATKVVMALNQWIMKRVS